MMRKLRVAVCALFLFSAPSFAWIHGAQVACPYGSALADGCAGSPGGNVQHSNFFSSYAPQSGQTYVTRPNWNVAGVDYPTGITPGTVLKDPTTDALPTGCFLQASNPYRVVCQSSSSALTIDGYDFSLHNCVYLQINNTWSGAVTIRNSKFAVGSGSFCTGSSIVIISSTSTLVFEKNYVDGVGPSFPSYAVLIDDERADSSGLGLYQYNVFLRGAARFIAQTGCNDITIKWNYGEGLVYFGNGGAHGEWGLIGTSCGTTIANFNFNFNTFLQPVGAGLCSTGVTAVSAVNNGSGNGPGALTFTNATNNNNVFATNRFSTPITASASGTVLTVSALGDGSGGPGSGCVNINAALAGTGVTAGTRIISNGTGTGQAGTYNLNNNLGTLGSRSMTASINTIDGAIEYAHDLYTNVTQNSNYIDPTGLSVAIQLTSGSVITNLNSQSGNVSLTSGNACNGFNGTTGYSCP